MTLVDDTLRSAIVAFSAEDVYGLADLMRSQRGGAAVVMGALSPRTRNAQVALYQSGEVDFLIATDAIGMGINMDVDHVAFAALEKYDGVATRPLAPQEIAEMASPADRRVQLFDVPASGKQDVEAALSEGDQVWKSLAWAEEGLAYRKQVVKNVARILIYFTEEYLHEIRQQIPKTRLEAEKDFFEAKRACDHLEGSSEAAVKGEMVRTCSRAEVLAGRVAAGRPRGHRHPDELHLGIPMIHLAGAYLAGCP
jgi:hypothetical protein